MKADRKVNEYHRRIASDDAAGHKRVMSRSRPVRGDVIVISGITKGIKRVRGGWSRKQSEDGLSSFERFQVRLELVTQHL